MTAFVICCNDTVQGCVLDDKLRAISLMGELVEANRLKQIKQFGDTSLCRSLLERSRWHIEQTEVTS